MATAGTVVPHPAFGHLLPQDEQEKASMFAFSRFFQQEKVPEGRMRGREWPFETSRFYSFEINREGCLSMTLSTKPFSFGDTMLWLA